VTKSIVNMQRKNTLPMIFLRKRFSSIFGKFRNLSRRGAGEGGQGRGVLC
jgi:hypothetical protein